MLIYLGSSALAVFLSSFVLFLCGVLSPVAAIHGVFALAVMPLIFGAITHFVPVLTRSAGAPPLVLWSPVLIQAAAVLLILFFTGELGLEALYVAAGIAIAVAVLFSGWLLIKAKHTLGKPHPCWFWYLAAIILLALGLLLAPAMYLWPQWRQAFRLLHLHLNTLGFIGLTAIATLQVLLPTVLSGPDAEATRRLHQDFFLALGGVLACSLGAALWWPLAVPGCAALLLVAGRLFHAWLTRYGWRLILSDGASAALLSALCGFLMCLALGVAHGAGLLSGAYAVAAFVAAFLLPLVSGALSQLLPVWRYPGRVSEARKQMRLHLVAGGGLRGGLFFCAGLLLTFGVDSGFWLALAGLLLFFWVMMRAHFVTWQSK